MRFKIGDKAFCSRGKKGTITKIRKQDDGRTLYIGVGEDGSNWQSIKPSKKDPTPKFQCPIKFTGCKSFCGSYGCGG